MTNPTRDLAQELAILARGCDPVAAPVLNKAAAAIDALLDAIEAGGMVQPRQAPQMDLGPLRELRAWHRARHDIIPPGTLGDAKSSHARAVLTLNRYFPQDDQL